MRWPILVGVLVATLTGAESAAYDICANLADCQRKAESDIAAGQYEQALESLIAVADLATAQGDNERLLSAFESLTAVNLKLGRPLKTHAWAQAALVQFENDPRAIANLETASQAVMPHADISGTYESYAGYGYWSELKVLERQPGKVETEWFMMRYGAVPSAWDYGPAAMWELSATGRYSNGDLVVTYEGMDGTACELAFKRAALAIEWVAPEAQDLSDNCRIGGADVFPWGPFWLVDSSAPEFDSGDGSAE